MNRKFYFLFVAALTGCTDEGPKAVASIDDRVYTVDEFLTKPVLRKERLYTCRNNPGELAMTPNCVNARRAEHIASAGTTIPSFTP